jgi:hypothetical protein
MRTRNLSSASESDSLAGSSYCLETPESGIACSEFTTPDLTFGEHSTLFADEITRQLIFKRVIQKCTLPMKIHGPRDFATAAGELFKSDQEIQQSWNTITDFYASPPLCHNKNRSMESDLVACFNALVGDERELMIGLDATSSLKDVIKTCIRILTEPEFIVELRIGLGGTNDPLNLRTPAYAIAGIDRLQQILALRDRSSGTIRKIILIPLLISMEV